MSTNDNLVCPTFVLKHASVSDLGMRRTNNQDSLAVIVTDDVATWATRGHLLMVADGMGAHAAGELASKLAVDNIPHTYFKLRDLYPPAALRQAIRDANTAIHAKGQSSIGFQGMGTTCSCLVLLPQGALVAHIGDSRVYRLRGDLLEQLTFDHSLVWEMAAAGQMTEADVPAYIPKNVITRSLGPHPTVHIDLEGPFSAQSGDMFLICSDGLSGPVTDEEIGAILHCLGPQEAAETLVDLANLRGGPDNISVDRRPGRMAPCRKPPALESAGECAASPHAGRRRRCGSPPAHVLAMLAYCLANQYWAGAIGSAVGFIAAVVAGLAFRSTELRQLPADSVDRRTVRQRTVSQGAMCAERQGRGDSRRDRGQASRAAEQGARQSHARLAGVRRRAVRSNGRGRTGRLTSPPFANTARRSASIMKQLRDRRPHGRCSTPISFDRDRATRTLQQSGARPARRPVPAARRSPPGTRDY